MTSPVLLVSAAAAGGATRYVIDAVIRHCVHSRALAGLPVGVVVVNVLGSMLLGAAYGMVAPLVDSGVADQWAQLAVSSVAAFCGTLTTFSTAALEVVMMLRAQRLVWALVFWLGMAVLCLVGAWACYSLAGALAR